MRICKNIETRVTNKTAREQLEGYGSLKKLEIQQLQSQAHLFVHLIPVYLYHTA
jgi:hypothetical protein